MQYKIGIVSHYYAKLKVAIISLDGEVSVGERIRFENLGDEPNQQTVTSIQVGHEKVTTGGKGTVIAIKTERPVKKGSEVFKLQ